MSPPLASDQVGTSAELARSSVSLYDAYSCMVVSSAQPAQQGGSGRCARRGPELVHVRAGDRGLAVTASPVDLNLDFNLSPHPLSITSFVGREPDALVVLLRQLRPGGDSRTNIIGL
jgi:hypothetical protein